MSNLKSGVDKSDIDKLEKVLNSLINWKSKVDKLDVDKLKPAPTDFKKIRDVVNKEVVKFLKKLTVIDTSELAKKKRL